MPGLSYGTPLSSSQLDAYANVPGTFVYSQPVGMLFPVGSTTVSVTFTPTDQADYNTATASVTIRVLKGTPQIAWPSPSPIVFGTALSGAQLDAVANVPGTLSYNHAAGDILPPGNQSIQVTFVPTDTADYNNAYASVTLTVANQVSFYVSEGPANSITSLTARGNTTTYSSSSSLSGTNGIAIDSAGNLYVANGSNYTIAKIAPSGSVSVVAANGLNFPVGLAIDTSGNLFVANYGNNTIAKVATGGLITGFVNSGLSGPAGLAFDPQGNLYEADSGSGTVLKISVGAGVSVFVRGLVEPSGLVFDSLGNLFVSDTGSGVIYKVAPSGSTRVFASGLNVPVGLACDPANTIYVVESGTGRILSVTSSGVVSVFASGLTVNDPQFIVAVPSPPFFTATPASLSVATGQPAALAVTAFGIPAPTYQWNLGGTPIAGATDPILLVNPALAGSYTCTSDNAAGSATSPPCVLSIIPGSIPGYLSNLSARGDVGAGGNMLIGGFAIPPQGQKNLLVRAVGPGLVAAFGVAGELPASQVTLYDSNQLPVVSNTGWANPPVPGTSPISVAARTASAVLMAQLGAFALAAGSTDSALAVTTAPGSYTAQMGGLGGGTGIGLFEIYDADSGIPTSHLVNISARAAVGSGGSILIGGFYIAGSAPDTLLIRGVGPGLALKFGLTGTLAQPVLSLFDSRGNLMVSNTGWGGDLTLTAVSGLVGAFSLSANSSDSVLLVTLPPGGYTAQLSGVNGSTGIGLLEIYEVP